MESTKLKKQRSLDHQWVLWIQENLRRKCRMEDIMAAMVREGFSREDALQAIKTQDRLEKSLVRPPVPPKIPALNVVSSNYFIFEGRKIPVLMELNQPRVKVFDQFLLPQECDLLIAKSKPHLSRSLAVDPISGKNMKFDQRTSQGTFFQKDEPGLIMSIENRCQLISGIPKSHGECIQVLRYGMGAEYQPHFDYFDPQFPGSAQQLVDGGQRIVTIIMYLNDVEAGGDTYFPELGFSVRPKKGQALLFFNLDSMKRLEPLTKHAGRPVLAGEKWIATRWIRLHPRKN